VHVKPVIRLPGCVALSVVSSLHHSPAHGQTAAGTGESFDPHRLTGCRQRGGEIGWGDAISTILLAMNLRRWRKEQIGIIEVPERPLQLLVAAGTAGLLFVLTQHSLYSANLAPIETAKVGP
jgi:hypothetical protein